MDVLIEKVKIDCPFCNKEHILEKRKRDTVGIVKGEQINFEEEYFLCNITETDENEFVTAKMMDENLLKARDEYRKKHDLLTSTQIKEIREKYKLTQAEFSFLLGVGEVTITRYESKSIQEEAYDKLMRLIDKDALLALDYLERNKSKFKDVKFRKTENNIKEVINKDTYNYLNIQEIYTKYIEYEGKSICNGFKEIDIDKIESVLKYVAQRMNNLYKVKLMKILWYIDFIYYKNHKKSMMGLVYSHQRMGALPIGFDEIIKLPSIIIDEQMKEYDGEYKSCYHILPNEQYKTKKLLKEELIIIDKVLNKFATYNTDEIVNYMHKEKAYQDTKQNDIIKYDLAEYISL